jgi:hypothetical protein
VIGETWTVDEILDAQSLDDLEGVGQAKRLTARLCAEIHNAITMGIWSIHGEKNSKPPSRIHESRFLPVRTAAVNDADEIKKRRDEVVKNVNDVMLSMCGY